MSALLPSQKQAKALPPARTKGASVDADASASFQVRCASALRVALPKELKARGAALQGVDIDALADSLARKVAKLADAPLSKGHAQRKTSASIEWISTQEAASRCGFSRPFVAALLDSGAYTGKVHRTAGGHRRVLANEFQALVAEAAVAAPKTLGQARKAATLNPIGESRVASRKERQQSKSRASALAHKLGLSV